MRMNGSLITLMVMVVLNKNIHDPRRKSPGQIKGTFLEY